MIPILISALVFCWAIADALALDPRDANLVSIGAVLKDPQHYNLHPVRFQGRITQLSVLPNQGGCRTIDAYLFHFEDEQEQNRERIEELESRRNSPGKNPDGKSARPPRGASMRREAARWSSYRLT